MMLTIIEIVLSIVITVVISNLCTLYSLNKSNLLQSLKYIRNAYNLCTNIDVIIKGLSDKKYSYYYDKKSQSHFHKSDVKEIESKLNNYTLMIITYLSNLQLIINNNNKSFLGAFNDLIRLDTYKMSVCNILEAFLYDNNLSRMHQSISNSKNITNMKRYNNKLLNNLNELESKIEHLNNIGIFKFECEKIF